MSRLYTALERSNSFKPESEAETQTTEPSSPTASEQSVGATETPDRTLPTSGDTGSGLPMEVEATPLPSLLINTSPSFRREMALLYRSLTLAADGRLQSVLICSAESGAGTSTIALNIAAYGGEEAKGKTLLIEANLQRPYLRRWSDRARTGFSDFLSNQGAVEQYIYRATTPGLQVMMAGRVSDHSDTLIRESRIRYLLTELQDVYPLIVFDGAPVVGSLGTLEIAKVVDGVVLVIRPDTLTKSVVQARTALENVGANTLGFAFNDF